MSSLAAHAAATPRADLIDALKVVAAHLIVWHHLAFYGPMSDRVAHAWPGFIDALSDHARLAVQVFLVAAGFLAARQLAPDGRLGVTLRPLQAFAQRYLRLVIPLLVALCAAIVAAAFARAVMDHAATPAAPDAWQLLAHALLVQDLLGIESLSAGLWYVAIDIQLYAVLLVALALGRGRAPVWTAAAVLGLVGLSLLHLNLDSRYDVLGPYFFGAYGLGVLVAWWGHRRDKRTALFALTLLVSVALILDFRARIAVAAATALALLWLPMQWPMLSDRARAMLAWLGSISYALFLVHYAVSLAVNAVFTRWAPPTPNVQGLGMLVAWAASIAAAAALYRWVEQPAGRWIKTLRWAKGRAASRA